MTLKKKIRTTLAYVFMETSLLLCKFLVPQYKETLHWKKFSYNYVSTKHFVLLS